MIIYIKKNN